jgi:hypothetical protein
MKILPSIFAVLRFALPLAWLLVTVLMTADTADGGEGKCRQAYEKQARQTEQP